MRLKITLVTLLCVIIAVSGSENISKSTVSTENSAKSSKIVQNPKVEVQNDVEKLKVEVIKDKVSELDEDEEDFDEKLEEKFDDVIQVPSSSSSPTEIAVKTSEEKSGKLELDPAIQNSQYDPNYQWDPNGRMAPPDYSTESGTIYTITEQRLAYLRSQFMYWFFDQDQNGGRGDFQFDIHASNQQLHKNFNFQLPFFGFRFNYTRLSLNGYLFFSDPPEHFLYPLIFPVKDWPKRNDPSFIGIWFSKCRIGRIYATDVDQREPGVYFRVERDLEARTDRFGVEVRERTMWDIRAGVVGADTFFPKHVVIATWKNVSFAGGIDNSLYRTNTFQMVLATDEVFTYAIFNYAPLKWMSHTEAGGDTTTGSGGTPAYVGFNAGNGTQSYEYKPYSQELVIRDLATRGWGNGFPGRHLFRLDEKILIGSCNKDIDNSYLPLTFAPEYGNMLGGTIVNITGPCFEKNIRVTCHFDTTDVLGIFVDTNRVICVQPYLNSQGYIRFEISVGTQRFKWRGKYFVETPALAIEKIFFETDAVHKKNPNEIKITWSQQNLTTNLNANVQISLWGYRETTIRPQLEYIDILEASLRNTGEYVISPANYRMRQNTNNDLQFGFIQINLTNPNSYSGLPITPILWSRPIPLGWYFAPQWEKKHGLRWPRALCDNWLKSDRFLRNFAADLPLCPCDLEHAVADKGRYMPDPDCDKDSNPTCLYHYGAIHCVLSGTPVAQGASQQCCYDRYGNLMLTYDQMWGSRPRRNHNWGLMPWNEASKVPSLSNWFHDMKAFYSCCYWQYEQAVGCETYRFERRPSQDCVAYQAPAVGAVFGDPHFLTMDGVQYTFNGMGEFVLVKGLANDNRFEVQGRFEQVPKNQYGSVAATQLTAIAAKGNTSTVIEVRLRPKFARWRYHLDVFADEKKIYFDRQSLRFQHFKGVTVYTPTYLLNQSQVIIMFDSGVGVEVVENEGFMTARAYLPWAYINKTAGLFGKWSFDPSDDFVLPDGSSISLNTNNFQQIYQSFGLKWMLADREIPGVGKSLFLPEFGRGASFYNNASFIPQFGKYPANFLPPNRSYEIQRAEELCGESYQCAYDYVMSGSRDMAHFTKNDFDAAVNTQALNAKRIISCGVLQTPRFGRKISFDFRPGAKVSFECDQGFILMGDKTRECMQDGLWNVPEFGYTYCLREVYYNRRAAFIAIGIIILVVLPIMLIIICCVYRYRQRQLQEDPDWKPSLPRSRQNSKVNLYTASKHAQLDDEDSDATTDTLKKPKMYDGSYNTHEPLPNKPNHDFPSKKFDLDDEDFSSSEGTGELKPKQLGRRSLRSSQDLINEHPDEDEHDTHAQMYSPTFSAAESNNYQPQGGYFNRTAPPPPHSPLVQDNGLPSPPASPQNTKSTEV